MKTITKTAIIGSAGILAAYFLGIRPKQKKVESNKSKASGDNSTQSREIEEKFNHLPLKAHSFLSEVPMHSLDFIQLKGGNKGMKMDEIYRLTGLNQAQDFKFGFITKTLFDIRGFIGKILGWDDVPELVNKNSWIKRLTKEKQAKSSIPSGKVEGINTILYCYENEILFEIINRTVHCFWVLASVEKADGYDLYVAIYVKKLNWRTPIYMALVSPMLKWVIYPAVKKTIKRNWESEFAKGENLEQVAT